MLRGVRLSATGLVDQPNFGSLEPGPAPEPIAHRRVYTGGEWHDKCRCMTESASTRPGIVGPAVVQSRFTALVLRPGDIAALQPNGDALVHVGSVQGRTSVPLATSRAWPPVDGTRSETGRSTNMRPFIYDEYDGMAWVTLNRPERSNAFNQTMQTEFRDIWRGLRANDDVGVVVLTAAGDKAFCAGFDRKEAKVGPDQPEVYQEQQGFAGDTKYHFNDPGRNFRAQEL